MMFYATKFFVFLVSVAAISITLNHINFLKLDKTIVTSSIISATETKKVNTTSFSTMQQYHQYHTYSYAHRVPTQCLNLDSDSDSSSGGLDKLLESTDQVFITMCAKCAGTSMKLFTSKCTNFDSPDNFLIHNNNRKEEFFTNSYELPSIITSHMSSSAPLLKLIKLGTRNTVIIYIHRDETDRIISAIRHVLKLRVCSEMKIVSGDKKRQFGIVQNKTHCVLDEQPIVTLIKARYGEMGYGGPEILNCDTYKAMEDDSNAKIVFVHYKQVNQLQKLLAKHHCPKLLENSLPIIKQVNKLSVFLRLKNGGSGTTVVNIEDWFLKKRNLIEVLVMAEKLDNGGTNLSCKTKTKFIEDDMFLCADETAQLFV